MGLPAMKSEQTKKRATTKGIEQKKPTIEKLRESARTNILAGIRHKRGLIVHFANPTPLFMIYKGVFDEMLEDSNTPETLRKKLEQYGRFTSLSYSPNPKKVKELASQNRQNKH